MKSIYCKSFLGFILVILLVSSNLLLAQNAVVGTGFTSGWNTTSNFEYLAASAGTSFIKTDVANGTGNQYFRMGVDYSGTVGQHTITIGADVAVSPNTEITLNSSSTETGAMYLNVTSTFDNYIFKTKDAGTSPSFKLIIFKVEGTIRSVNSVNKNLSTVNPGQAVTVTATLDGALSTGQGVYLRYSNDNFTNSSVVEMTGAGTSYTSSIPSEINTLGASIKYYVFTSGNGLTPSGANADWYTINLNNNSGANYTYAVASSYTTAAAGNWSAAGTWSAGVVPPSGQPVKIDHNVTLNQDATVSSLTISSGKTFTGADGTNYRTLTIANGGTLANSGTFTCGTNGSVSFAGSGTVTGTVLFKNIDIHGAVTFSANTSIKGNFTIYSNGYVAGTTTPTYNSGSVLIYSTANAINNPYNRGYEWGTSSSPNKRPYDVNITENTYVNLGANIGAGSGIATARTCLGGLTINAGSGLFMDYSTYDMSAALTVTGDFSNSGTFSLSDASGGDLKIIGNMVASGTFNHHDRAVFFIGSISEQLISCEATTFGYLIIDNAAGVKINTDQLITVADNLTINTGKKLTISSTSMLTVNGNIINSQGIAGLVINSDEFGTGSLINSTANVSATVERYLTDYVEVPDFMFHFLSSPVEAQPIQTEFVSDPIADYTDFYSFSESENMWINSRGTGNVWNADFESNFEVGKGYLVAYPDIVTKNFRGTLNPHTSAKVLACTYTTGKGNGWNLLGNPFSSAIDWDYIAENNYLGDGVDNALYYYDNASANYMYYIVFPDDNVTVGGGKPQIPATQGFMVHANATGADKTITIPFEARTHTGQNVYYKSLNTAPESLSLKVAGNGYSDEAYIHFNSDATPVFDGKYDAFKLKSYNIKVPMIYTKSSEGSDLAINGLPEFNEETLIPVFFTTETAGEYTLNANLSGFENSKVYLKDKKTNIDRNLTENPSFSFTSAVGDDPNRFLLHFKQTTGVSDEADDQKLEFVYANGALYLSGLETDAEIRVTNMLGQVVLSRFATGSDVQELNTSGLSKGVYILSVLTGSQKKSGKFVVR